MVYPNSRICRYFNAPGGCWYGQSCNFLHIPENNSSRKFPCNGPQCDEVCISVERTLKTINNTLSSTSQLKNFHLPETNNDSSKHPIKRLQVSGQQWKTNAVESDFVDKENAPVSADASTTSSKNFIERDDKKAPLAGTPECNISTEQTTSLNIRGVCGSCDNLLCGYDTESYFDILKYHYLQKFLNKDVDHVKSVRIKVDREFSQKYWCKSCNSAFDRPQSLFQHIADKAKGAKVPLPEKENHLDLVDSVADLMAAYDLEIFSRSKLRSVLRNLLLDQQASEVLMENTTLNASKMFRLLVPLTNLRSSHRRELMRRMEDVNDQIARRVAHAAAPSRNTFNNSETCHSTSLNQISPSSVENTCNLKCANTRKLTSKEVVDKGTTESFVRKLLEKCSLTQDEKNHICNRKHEFTNSVSESRFYGENREEHIDNTSCDHSHKDAHYNNAFTNSKFQISSGSGKQSSLLFAATSKNCVFDSTTERHSTKMFPCRSKNKYSDVCAPRSYNYLRKYSCYSKKSAYANNNSKYISRTRTFTRNFRIKFPRSLTQYKSLFRYDSSSDCDMVNGFTKDEVEELLCQGIKPWDEEASAALAILHGEWPFM